MPWEYCKRVETKMKPKIYDLTPKISPELKVFPGDQPFARKIALSFASHHHLELSSMQATLHLGAHADAPSHYHASGEGISEVDVLRYFGRCQVIRVSGLGPRERVHPAHIQAPIRAARVLIDTQSFPDPQNWNADFCAFSPDLLHALADQGVRLVGIDTPSVDPEDDKSLAAHQVLFARQLRVLEGLLLNAVPEGIYTLAALPLPIVAGDASPVRAVLFPELQEVADWE
jgi:arylformamidase